MAAAYRTENTIVAAEIESVIAEIHAEQVAAFCDGDFEKHQAKIQRLERELELLTACGFAEIREAA